MANSELFDGFRKLFFYFGFWTENHSKIFRVHGLFVLLVTVYLTFGFALAALGALNNELGKFGVTFGALLTMMVTLVKIVISRSPKFHSLLDGMFRNEEYISSKTDGAIQGSYIGYTRTPLKIVNFYKTTMGCTLMSHSFISIFLILRYKDTCTDLSCEKPLLFPYWMPFDKQKYYVLANIYLSVSTILSGMVVCACDILVLAPIVYLICRLQTLKFVLSHPTLFFKEEIPDETNYYLTVRLCVMEHQALIKELKMFNSMTMYLLLFDFFFHSTQIAGFIISIIASPSLKTIENIFALACSIFVLLQLLLVYWHGQILIDESENIPLAILESDWTEADVKTRRLLMLIMIRSQRPLALTVGPLFLVNLEIFLKIVKTVYTITTVFLRG